MGDTKNVRVDSDGCFFECYAHHDVRCLPPNAGQRLKRVPIAGNLAIMLFEEAARCADDVARLHAEETRRFNQFLDVFLLRSGELLRRRIFFEKCGRHHVHPRVRGLRRENHRDEQLKRIFVIERRFRLRIRLF